MRLWSSSLLPDPVVPAARPWGPSRRRSMLTGPAAPAPIGAPSAPVPRTAAQRCSTWPTSGSGISSRSRSRTRRGTSPVAVAAVASLSGASRRADLVREVRRQAVDDEARDHVAALGEGDRPGVALVLDADDRAALPGEVLGDSGAPRCTRHRTAGRRPAAARERAEGSGRASRDDDEDPRGRTLVAHAPLGTQPARGDQVVDDLEQRPYVLGVGCDCACPGDPGEQRLGVRQPPQPRPLALRRGLRRRQQPDDRQVTRAVQHGGLDDEPAQQRGTPAWGSPRRQGPRSW